MKQGFSCVCPHRRAYLQPIGLVSNGIKAGSQLSAALMPLEPNLLPVWVIGKARMPRALGNINIPAMGAEWRWNKKAWVDQIVMREWLLAFY